MTRMLGQRAVVVGASVVGRLASRALSEHFDEVVVLDSDEIEDGPVVHKSVPQGYHLHALLQGGLRVLSSLDPAFTEDLKQLGATRIAIGRDAAWYLPNGKGYTPTGWQERRLIPGSKVMVPVAVSSNLSFVSGRLQVPTFDLSTAERFEN